MLSFALPRKTLYAPIALLAILSAMTGFLVFSHFATARESKALLLHSHEVIEAAQTLFADVQDVESGARGFLIGGNPRHLDDYRSGLARLPRDTERLETLLTENPAQLQRMRRLQSLLETRTKIAAMRVDLGLAGKLPEARTAQFGAGKAAMDEARVVLSELVSAEKTLLERRTRQSRTAEIVGVVIALGFSALSILGLGVLVVALFRANGQMARQIAAREVSEAARREADLIYRAVFDNVGESLFVIQVDPAGVYRVLDVNRAFEEGAGLSVAELRGKDVREVMPIVAEAMIAHFELVIAKGDTALVRTEARRPSGVRVWETTLTPLRDEAGRIDRIVGAGRDVTERERSEAQVRTAQKMEAIGHLTGGVAHDFNNLLQVIRGNLELMEPHVRHIEQAEPRLRNALHGAERAAQLTRQLLAFARRQPLEPKVVNLGRLLNNMADLLRRSLADNVDIQTLIPGGLWNTLADPAQVESAILNLAINARDAMPDGGRLVLEVGNRSFAQTQPIGDHLDIDAGDYVVLSITDTGTGMTREVAERVFEPFFTTKGVERGTGLGLSMVYGFVKQSNGHIHINSAPNAGTTINIYLPRTEKAEEPAAPKPAPRALGPNETILVVEDEAMVRSAAVGMLRGMGYACVHAENAQAAIELLDQGLKPDLIFTDVVMPGSISSRDMVARALALHPNVPVLFTSGYPRDAIVHDGRLDEGVNLLSKPYQKDDLALRIRELLDGVRPVVLVVEDEPLVRLSAVDMIEEIGFSVLEAGDAPEALKYLESDNRIDILFCDIGLPGMRGPELAQRAIGLRPGLKVVFASGYGEAAGGVEGGELLSKPYDSDDLARTLRS